MDKTDRLRDYGLAFLLYEQGLGICGYELIRELFIFIKLILNSYLLKKFGFLVIIVKQCDVQFIEFRMSFDSDLPLLPCRYCPVTTSLTLKLPANVMLTHVVIIQLFCFGL